MESFAPTSPPIADPQTAYCLECGYDLTGIPETRCPECGFGFTRNSTLWMAKSFARVKLTVFLLLATSSHWPAGVLVGIALVMLLSLPRAYPYFKKSVGLRWSRSVSNCRTAAYAALIAAVAALMLA